DKEGRGDPSSCEGVARKLLGGAGFVCALFVAAVAATPAVAQTLEEALAQAYLINPVLNAERANLRATDENVPIAKSRLRPNISGSADAAIQKLTTNRGGGQFAVNGGGGGGGFTGDEGTTYPHSLSVQLSQPIFQGFQILNAIRQAKSGVQAAREGLRATEQNVLLAAATAYVNVVRERAVVRLRENDVSVLNEQLKATRDRFEVGEVTRTDVAQAEARVAEARAILALAQANLKTSEADYQQVIGDPPGVLVTPPSIRHLLPSTLDEAMTLGDGENPIILASVYAEEASLYNIQQLMGQLLPNVSLDASYSKSYAGNERGDWSENTVVSGRVTVPFYQGGGVAASVRQAKEDNNRFKKLVEDARLGVHADVLSQWGFLQSSGPQIASAQAAVEANKIALTGVQEEEKVGQRTTLDVLDAQRELLNSQILLVRALRDRIVAEYSLFAAIGRMDAQTLGLPVPYYDPFEHYDIVKNKWFGLRPPAPPAPDE
ncbi:MAG: TolC family outer membrane protein, partial [Methyloceanibacter sp.]